MRKIVAFAIIALVAISVLAIAAFFWATLPEKPNLTLTFRPPLPPWRVRPGYSFQISIEVVNNAGTSSIATGVQVRVVAPNGFIISGNNTNQWKKNFGDIRGGDSKNETLTVNILIAVQPGNYTIETRTWAENVLEQVVTSQVIVELALG